MIKEAILDYWAKELPIMIDRGISLKGRDRFRGSQRQGFAR